jgi:uncharacterized protein (TIGR02246 family)
MGPAAVCVLVVATSGGLSGCRTPAPVVGAGPADAVRADTIPVGARPVDAGRAAAARAEVAAALERYQRAARAVDAAAIAGSFTPDGVLFEPGIHPIVTRDSIRAFVESFPGVRVHAATATADAIDVYGDRAYLWGTYFEHLSFPGQPTSEQHGRFVAEWSRQPDGRWLIARLYRIPLPSR